MDSISGAPVGLYTASYLWIYLVVLILKRFVHPGNLIFLPLISAFSIMIENGFLFFSFFVKYGLLVITVSDLMLAGRQMLCGFFVIPVSVMLIDILHTKCDRLDSRTL
ncbi:hypothetical protein [Desulfamplus magnetovallimortis]|nr:hypothetical protein [Desulfamplus magnetovallimortis]